MDKFIIDERFDEGFSLIETFIQNIIPNDNLQTYIEELKFYLHKLIRLKKDNNDVAAVIDIVYYIILNAYNKSFCKGVDRSCDFCNSQIDDK